VHHAPTIPSLLANVAQFHHKAGQLRVGSGRAGPARLGRHRWTIERTGAWLGGFRRLRIRYERCAERFYALAMLACSVICSNALQQPPW
jgi:transposase